MMRVLIATDGSAGAETALRLAASIGWPDDSTIRLVTVVESPMMLYALPFAPALPSHVDQLEADLAANAERTLEEASGVLAAAGRSVERQVLRGRPGSAIVDEAATWGADLVLLGSRGHGAIASMVLGSVSAEVVDHAPCPVLVARRPALTRVLFGHDGSEFASAAEEALGSWPIFERTAIDVVSVAQVDAPWRTGIAPTIYAEAIEWQHEATAASTVEHTRLAEESAHRLNQAGRRASALVLVGEPAAILVRVAEERQADLIVVGTHGRTGFTLVLLGSVARNVMQHATCSVMVVRSRGAQPAAG